MRIPTAALAISVAASSPAYAQAATGKPASTDAQRIVTALHLAQQIEFLTPKLSPAYAEQMLATLTASERFKSQLAAPGGRARLRSALQEAFEHAFHSHVAELVEDIARDYDQRLSPADLHQVAAFLAAGAGARWAAAVGDIQQASSSAGARAGALAGEEAYDTVLKRLDPQTGLIK